MAYVLALLIGVVAGLRTMTAPTVVSWAAYLGWIDVSHSSLAFLGYRWTPWILSLLAIAEFVTDQLPSTPSRKGPMQFAARIVTGAISGAALAVAISGNLFAGLAIGAIGAVIGTLGGAAVRQRLATAFGRDRPAAIVEDIVAIGGALLIVRAAA